MADVVTRITVFIASPGDVEDERQLVFEAVQDLNDAFAGSANFILECKGWEKTAWPGFGADPQDVINRELGEYDIFVGIFWNRLGTPTARAESGTVEEFRTAYERWTHNQRPSLMLYFRTSAANFLTVDEADQKKKLLEFKGTLNELGGLFFEYASPDQFRRLITKHLTKELISLTKKLDLEHLNRRVEHQEQVLTAQQEKLKRQQEIVNSLVTYSVGEHVFRHLQFIYHSQMKHPGSVQDYKFQKWGPMPQEIRFLVDHGYIELLNPDTIEDQQDLTKIVKLTPIGTYYVDLREQSEPRAASA